MQHNRHARCETYRLAFKNTESIFISATYTDDDGVTPLPLPAGIICQIRNIKDELVADMQVIVEDKAQGRFTLTTDTKLAVGKYRADVLFADGSNDMPTEQNFEMVITKGISRKG